ncbi:hypothetical protein AtubIFM54640_010194 [Aspergillus tubingensis]|nr:hypothetical protein AtubIFM54640_010194 [Aspergillus tubingensis]
MDRLDLRHLPMHQIKPRQQCSHRKRLFSRLHIFGEKLKRQDHLTIHPDVEHALQYIETQDIQSKFFERATAMPQEQSEEAGKALQTCVSHLDSCLKFGELIGTSQWSSDDDWDLSIAWSLFMDNFNIASHLLNLAELDLHLFLGLQPQASPTPRLVALGLIREESTSSATSSRAETIEYWEDLRGRQEQDRLAGRRPDSIPSDLPPPYEPPKPPIRILDDKGHHGDPQLHVVHRVASDSTLDISAPSNTKIRLYGSNNTFNNYATAPQLRPDLRPTPSMMMHWQPPGAPPRFFTPPLPPQRPQTYKPSCTSLRETAALHLLRRGAPDLILHAFKPEVTCEHGVVHFKQHDYCGCGDDSMSEVIIDEGTARVDSISVSNTMPTRITGGDLDAAHGNPHFLGEKVPNTPFPKGNDPVAPREQVAKITAPRMRRAMRNMALTVVSLSVVAVVTGLAVKERGFPWKAIKGFLASWPMLVSLGK